MTTITSTSLTIRNSILRSIALGGMMVGLLHLMVIGLPLGLFVRRTTKANL